MPLNLKRLACPTVSDKAGTTVIFVAFKVYFFKIARTDVFENRRDVSKRLMLPEGRYCVLPSTFNKGDEAEFNIRVFEAPCSHFTSSGCWNSVVALVCVCMCL